MTTKTDFAALRRKAYHPSKLTDRELAQLRRSSHTGANLLYKIVLEQHRRGLLKGDSMTTRSGMLSYMPEKAKRISDYPEDQISPHIF